MKDFLLYLLYCVLSVISSPSGGAIDVSYKDLIVGAVTIVGGLYIFVGALKIFAKIMKW